MDFTPHWEQIFDNAYALCVQKHGEAPSNPVLACAVDMAVKQYSTPDGREAIRANIGAAKAQLRHLMVAEDPQSQITFDIADAVLQTIEALVAETN